jgi:hypothetical protein
MSWKFRNADGKAAGTQGWEADHERASMTCYTGLWRGNKVVALLVAKGDYDGMKAELDKNGEFIVRACNAYDGLVSDNANMREDLNDARRGWESAAEAVREADEVREKLVSALRRMVAMYEAMLKQTNVGASFFGGETLQEMNEAPIGARAALTAAGAA